MFENTCQAVEQLNGEFIEQTWTRDEKRHLDGWRIVMTQYILTELCTMANGKVGVNYVAIRWTAFRNDLSEVSAATAEADQMHGGHPYFATGTSFVIHPYNPMVPIAHQLSLFPDRWCSTGLLVVLAAVQISHQRTRKMQFISIRCIKFATSTIPPITTL